MLPAVIVCTKVSDRIGCGASPLLITMLGEESRPGTENLCTGITSFIVLIRANVKQGVYVAEHFDGIQLDLENCFC